MTSRFKITSHDLARVEQLIKNGNLKGHQLNRLRFIQYKYNGFTNAKISKLLGKCNKTIVNWTNKFVDKGLDAFVFIDYNRHTSKLMDIADDIRHEMRKNGFTTTADIVLWAKKKGIITCVSNMQYFIKKNSIVLSKNRN